MVKQILIPRIQQIRKMISGSSSDSGSEDSDEALIHRIQDRLVGDEGSHGSGSRSRGRPRIQEQWGRVISMSNVNVARIKTFVVAADLLLASGLPSII